MADNVPTVRGVYEAFAKGDVSVLLGVLDDKVEWHEAEHITYWPGGPYVGPQAVRTRQTFSTTIPGWRHISMNVTATEERPASASLAAIRTPIAY